MKTFVVVSAFLLLSGAGLFAGPTWLAHALADGRDPRHAVAPPTTELFDVPLYFMTDVEQFGAHAKRVPGVFAVGFALTFGPGAVGLGLLMLTQRSSMPPKEEVGRERWMTPGQARRAGLMAGRGVVIGQFGSGRWRLLLTFDGPEHQLVTGASRSGKGVGHVVPTLLTWHRSALIYDVKGELWEVTSGWRSRFSHCVRFNPTDATSARYNPLMEVRRGACEIRDAQNVAEMLIDDGSGRPRSEPWDSETAQLLTATILHVLYTEPDGQKHLGRVRDLILDLDKTLERMLATRHLGSTGEVGEESDWGGGGGGGGGCHPEVKAVAQHLRTQAPKFRDSVRGTASARLVLWADPIVRQVTSASDFASGDLMCLEHPLSLYIQPPPADAARVRPLTRLMFHQLTRALMEHLDRDAMGRRKRHRLLLLLDEFPTLRKMEFVSEGLRQMAGYGIKAMIVAQSFQDIEEHYGAKQTIIDNCHVLTCFAAADTGTAQRISQMTGMATELRRSFGHRPTTRLLGPGRSVSYSEGTRPLLMPGDVRELPYDTQLVFVTGHPPLRCRKVRHYADRLFRSRLLPAPKQAQGAVDLPASPTNPWQGICTLSTDPAGREVDSSTDEHAEEPPEWEEAWVDSATGELIPGDAPLNEAQRLHLQRLCPEAEADEPNRTDRATEPNEAMDAPPASSVASALSSPFATASTSAPDSPRDVDDTFFDDLFS